MREPGCEDVLACLDNDAPGAGEGEGGAVNVYEAKKSSVRERPDPADDVLGFRESDGASDSGECVCTGERNLLSSSLGRRLGVFPDLEVP